MSENQGQRSFSIDIAKVSQELHVREEILKKLVISFSKTITGKMQGLREALDANDVMAMRRILHELKGTSGNLRLSTVSEAVNVLHLAVKGGEAKEKLEEYYGVLKLRADEFVEYARNMEVSQTT